MSAKMKKDARFLINLKRAQKLAAKKNLVTARKIVDARQILKGKQKVKNKIVRNSQPQANLFKKQFKQVLFQQQQNQRRNRLNFRKNADKIVKVERGGILKITSRAKNSDQNNDVVSPKDKVIVSNMTGITVTTRNRPSEPVYFEEAMEEGDELERMTLNDLPDLQSIKSLPRGLITMSNKTAKSVTPTASNSSLFSHLQSSGSTMVADTVVPQSMHRVMSWRVLITNLHPAVSEEDIIELFGHVGPMKSAQILKPGSAIVEYCAKEDAIQACEAYHNRLLDGQPMQCVMEADVTPSRTPVTLRLGEKFVTDRVSTTSVRFPRQTASSVFRQTVPDVGASSSRRVAFTVKLP